MQFFLSLFGCHPVPCSYYTCRHPRSAHPAGGHASFLDTLHHAAHHVKCCAAECCCLAAILSATLCCLLCVQAPTLLAYSHIRLVRVLLSWMPRITRLVMPYAALLSAAVWLPHSALLVLHLQAPTLLASSHIRLVCVLLSWKPCIMPDAALPHSVLLSNRCCLAATICAARATPAGTHAPCILPHPAGARAASLDSSHHGRCCAANRCCLAAYSALLVLLLQAPTLLAHPAGATAAFMHASQHAAHHATCCCRCCSLLFVCHTLRCSYYPFRHPRSWHIPTFGWCVLYSPGCRASCG
jgi:uncharacterized membrane protein (DUF2068 family)